MPQTIQDDFVRAAKQYPDQVAVWSEQGTITYRELDERSSAFAAWLLQNQYAPGERTALILSKSVDTIVAIIGTLKAGNAYIPLGSTWPTNRINSILSGGAFKVIVIEKEDETLDTSGAKVLGLHTDEWTSATTSDPSNIDTITRVAPTDLAYILYTSGSTGVPKGVCVSHSAAFYFPDWAKKEFNIDHNDRVASIAPFTFDLSTFDLFATLLSGASIYLVAEKHKLLPSRFSQFLQDQAITVMYAVPSTLSLLTLKGHLKDRDLSNMKTVLFAGEVFLPSAYLQFKACMPEHVQYYNLYGPTETNVCTYYKMDESFQGDASIPIGLATPGTRLYLRAEDGGMDENAEEGELCVAGPTVMSGYWGDQNKNADCWVDVPDDEDLKAYRTGDIVTKADNGNWMYKGRRDKMVKIFGYRVELGEIESGLLKYSSIEQAAVIKRSKKGNLGEELVAFVVSADSSREEGIDLNSVYKHCKQYLPHFMVPRKVYELEDLPINNSGKVDRLNLETLANEYQTAEK